MNQFLTKWGEAAYTTAGFFWMALWAFILGYIVSSMIQVIITEDRMQKTMGGSSSKSIFLGAFFGFISSSCSFSALAAAKALFQKGASFIGALAFLLASTNLVIELGIIIAVFLGWQFVAGEYIGGLLLIAVSWILVKIINPVDLISEARKNLGPAKGASDTETDIKDRLKSGESWAKIGKQYGMEWKMVWKDVTIGFTIAGIVSSFVPDAFFRTLFINTGSGQTSFGFFTLLEHIVVGPVAAFMTFIGSMGNIPLAALLFGKGVSFAGVMAFIFSDLVVFPILRINAKYYGWKMSLFILFLLFISLISASLLLHYSFQLSGVLPQGASTGILNSGHFKINYTFFLNIIFLIFSGSLIYYGFFKKGKVKQHKEMAPKSPVLEKTLKYLAFISFLWLFGGIVIKFLN